jgi:HKD family nuclease
MEIRLIDNKKSLMSDALNQAINNSFQIKLAIAFAKLSGFRLIEESFRTFIKNKGRAIFLVGLDFHTTDPDLLRELVNYCEIGHQVEIYCLRGNLQRFAVYHPKMYLFDQSEQDVISIIGSSNLTKSGLVDNVELNVEIKMKNDEELYSDLSESFLTLEMAEHRIRPNHEYIDYYEELFRQNKRGKDIQASPQFNKLKELEESLQRPEVKAGDLSGWMKLIYRYLPDHSFTNQDIYKFEKELKAIYTENKNIKAKIRQQLQVLRDLGLLDHLSRNKWQKRQK